jgi:hypothetical protein
MSLQALLILDQPDRQPSNLRFGNIKLNSYSQYKQSNLITPDQKNDRLPNRKAIVPDIRSRGLKSMGQHLQNAHAGQAQDGTCTQNMAKTGHP